MQAVRLVCFAVRCLPRGHCPRRLAALRCLSTAPSSSSSSSGSDRPVPWFVDTEAERSYDMRPSPPHLPSKGSHMEVRPVPEDAPGPVKLLHNELIKSPYLDPTELLVCVPPEIPPGPPLPEQAAKGRRRRGRTNAGVGVNGPGGSLWNWLVLAVVKEGTEKRGSVESVVRLVRRTLCKMSPPVHLPPNTKRKVNDTWAMIDGGSFAVHILSKSAKEKYFTRMNEW